MGIDIDFVSLDGTECERGTGKACRKHFHVPTHLAELFERHELLPVPERARFLAVFGSRTLGDLRARKIIERYVHEKGAEIIVTAAEPVGICALAQKYAREEKIALQTHFLRMDKYAKGAHEHRSDDVIKACDCVLFIHDGNSKGTYNEILRAIHFRKPFIYEHLEELKNEGLFCEFD